jgi:nucleotide-binding universal stress UspA family protein
MKTILVPLDGSALAEQILPSVRSMATLMPSTIHLLHVVSEADRYHLLFDDPYNFGEPSLPATPGAATQQATVATSWDILRQNATTYLSEQAERLNAAGFHAEYEIRLGDAPEVIAETAANTRANMIAMATHGYSGLRRWALGSVTDKVLHITNTPMLIVRGSAHKDGDPKFKRIMLTLDGSPLARQAIPLAVEIASEAQAELVLMTAVAPPYLQAPELMGAYYAYDEALVAVRDRLKDELGAYAEVLNQHNVAVEPVAVSGLPAEAIVDEAEERKVDLIVMATHGAGGLRRWALGSVADKILHASNTPLLVVRAQE